MVIDKNSSGINVVVTGDHFFQRQNTKEVNMFGWILFTGVHLSAFCIVLCAVDPSCAGMSCWIKLTELLNTTEKVKAFQNENRSLSLTERSHYESPNSIVGYLSPCSYIRLYLQIWVFLLHCSLSLTSKGGSATQMKKSCSALLAVMSAAQCYIYGNLFFVVLFSFISYIGTVYNLQSFSSRSVLFLYCQTLNGAHTPP